MHGRAGIFTVPWRHRERCQSLRLIVRELLPDEVVQLRGHLLRLTREDRALRFMGYVADEVVSAYCEGIDWAHTVVVGFFSAGLLRGAAELHIANSPTLDEVAITVEVAWQHQGVATELLSRLLIIAGRRSSGDIEMQSLPENYRIQRLARKFGARVCSRSGTSIARIPVPVPLGTRS